MQAPLTTLIGNRKFISKAVEDNLRAIANKHGYLVAASTGGTSKVCALTKSRLGRTETVYYMRQEGLGKGFLRLLVRPDIGPEIDKLVLSDSATEPHHNKNYSDNPRLLSSSNFSDYNNRGLIASKNEHVGWGTI